MSLISVARILAFLVVAVINSRTDEQGFLRLLIVFAIIHYAMAVSFGWRNILAVVRRPVSAISAGGVTAASLWMYASSFPLWILFLAHHVFNEVFLTKKEVLREDAKSLRVLIWSALAFNTVLYFLINRSSEFAPLYQVFFCLSFGAGAFFVYCLIDAFPKLGVRRVIDASVVELLTVIAICSSSFAQVGFLQVVFYHFAFWSFYPMIGMVRSANTSAVVKYLGATACATGVALLVSPLSMLAWHLNDGQWYELFFFGSVIHIMSSFVISKAQPEFIWQFFLGAPRPVPAYVSEQPAREKSGASV